MVHCLLIHACLADTPRNHSFELEVYRNDPHSGAIIGKDGSPCQNHTWLVESKNGQECECADPLDGIIYCDSFKDVYISAQFCMAYDERVGEEVVGSCPYTYSSFMDPNVTNIGLYIKLPNMVDMLEQVLCDRLNRQGYMCSKCKEGYGYPMYPDFMKCVQCHPSYPSMNWLQYIVMSFGPLTLFLILVVCLRISATSASMNAFIFISQIISHPPFERGFNHVIRFSFLPLSAQTFIRFLYSLYGLWNLNFFTAMIPPFCLPHQNVFSVISLTYTIAMYPLLVLLFVYILIELHSRNFRLLVWLWKPVHICYTHFRRQWDIRASIIDAFATFFLLSYVNLLFVSIDFLAPSQLWNKRGSVVEVASYFDASAAVSPEPKTILIITGVLLILLLLVFLPTSLLLLYPCHFCQKCLTCSHLHFQSLHFLMNSLLGCYKDGTNGTRDCRIFASIFLMVRIVISVEYVVSYFDYHTAVLITCTCLAVMIAVVQPYNKQNALFNRLDPLMIFFLVVWIALLKIIRQSAGKHIKNQHSAILLCFIIFFLPFVFIFVHWLKEFAKKKCNKRPIHTSHSFEDSLEQRCHCPHTPQSRAYGSLNAEHTCGKLHETV